MSQKIFDFVFYDGNFELIDLRINTNSEFNPSIFIISQSKFSSHFSKIPNQQSNIELIIDDENLENKKYYSRLIKDRISKSYKDFDDLVFICENQEIPILEKIKFENYDFTTTNLLFHKIYEYSLDYSRKYLEYGCGMVSFSHILQNPNFLGNLFSSKVKLPLFLSYNCEGMTIHNYKIESEKKETYTCPYSNIEVPLIYSK